MVTVSEKAEDMWTRSLRWERLLYKEAKEARLELRVVSLCPIEPHREAHYTSFWDFAAINANRHSIFFVCCSALRQPQPCFTQSAVVSCNRFLPAWCLRAKHGQPRVPLMQHKRMLANFTQLVSYRRLLYAMKHKAESLVEL